MKKLLYGVIVIALIVTFSVLASANNGEKTALPSNTKFIMDGKEVSFKNAYLIDGSNYLQLRAVAELLTGTKSQFNVYWDDTLGQAIIETGKAYTGIAPVSIPKSPANAGDILTQNKTISIAGVDIVYDGYYEEKPDNNGDYTVLWTAPSEHFTVKNNNNYDVIVGYEIVGVKKDGTHELLLLSALVGNDQRKYDKDFAENGWAVMSQTTRINANSSMDCIAQIFEYGTPLDIDSDGYYSIKFCIQKQSGDGISVSTDAPKSDVYRLKVHD